MARSLNKAMLIGNLGSDPEVRTTNGGQKVASFSIATSNSWTDKSGAKQERTQWHRIVLWRGLAEIAEKYIKKGDRVYIEGEISYRSYENKDGQTVYVTEIEGREMMMLSGGRSGEQYNDRGESRQQSSRGASAQQQEPAGVGAGYDGGDDDLPF